MEQGNGRYESAGYGSDILDGFFGLTHNSVTLDDADSTTWVGTGLKVGRGCGILFVTGNGQGKYDGVHALTAAGDFTNDTSDTTLGSPAVTLSEQDGNEHIEVRLNNSTIEIRASNSGHEGVQYDLNLLEARNG